MRVEDYAQDADVKAVQALLIGVAKALVNDPDAVEVVVIPDHEGFLLRLHVAPEDLGKIIGKQGRTARSIRTILAAFNSKRGRRFSLDIPTSEQN